MNKTVETPVSKDAAGRDQSMNSITDRPDEDPKLISSIQRFLFDAEYHRAQILVLGEVIPVFSSVEVFLVGFLFDRGELESLILFPLFFDGSFLSRQLVGVRFVLIFGQFCVRRISTLALVPNRICGDLLSGTLDPVSRCGHQVVRELVTKFVCKESFRRMFVNNMFRLKVDTITIFINMFSNKIFLNEL